MALKELSGQAARSIAADRSRCLDALRDVETWPEWISAIQSVHVEERPEPGEPIRVGVFARLLALPLVFAADVTSDESELVIRRVPHEDTDPERLEIRVRVAPEAGGARATAEISAELDVPRLVPLPAAVGDQIAARLLTDLDRRAAG
jgi:hypothetical protein